MKNLTLLAMCFHLSFCALAIGGLRYITPIAGATAPSFTNVYSANFNGTTSIQTAPNNAAIDFDNADSFCGGGWVKTSASGNQWLFSKLKPDPVILQGYGIQINTTVSPSLIRFYIIDSANNQTFKRVSAVSGDGSWHHIGWKYNGNGLSSGISIFVDGNLIAAESTQDAITSSIKSGAPLILGSIPIYGQFLTGNIDEFFISAGTACNFATIYNAGKPASLAAFNPLVWLREENNNTDSGSLGLTFTDTAVTYQADVP